VDNLEYKLYHGTNKKSANKIVREQLFIPGKDEDNEDFLGKGIYFFGKNQHAVLWNLKIAKDKGKRNLSYKNYVLNYAVVGAKINLNRSNLLDLEDANDIAKYEKICKRFEKEFEEDEEFKRAKHKDRAIINYFYKNGYMEGIYAIRKIMWQNINTSGINIAKQMQREIFCVKRGDIVSDIEIVENVEENTYKSIQYISFY
jgi:hypothetical protein